MVFCSKCHKPIRVGYRCENCKTSLPSYFKVVRYDLVEERDAEVNRLNGLPRKGFSK